MTTSEDGSTLSRRSSSQASRVSSESKRAKASHPKPRRTPSKSSGVASPNSDPSLTSFPSFSPEQAHSKLAKRSGKASVNRTVSQKTRERKATLAGLTSASPLIGQPALFDDSPRTPSDIPGSLHLASDEHIKRLIARTGAIKLVRQFAQDLAQRDAELTSLRMRADGRERELKKFLREADVASTEIERRLLRLENADPFTGPESQNIDHRTKSQRINGMLTEAIDDELTPRTYGRSQPKAASPTEITPASGVPPVANSNDPSSTELSETGVGSRNSSLYSNHNDREIRDTDRTIKPRATSAKDKRLPGLDGLFQTNAPSSSYFIGGTMKNIRKQKAVDEVSVRSNQSSSSFASWTKLFGGNSAPRKDDGGRPRSTSLEQTTSAEANPFVGTSTISRIHTNPHQAVVDSASSNSRTGTIKAGASGRRTPSGPRLSTSPGHARKDSNASDFPPTVEMDSMIESSQLPPTMTTRHHTIDGLLTDRFGFIYDQRQRKRQAAAALQHKRNKLSATETLASLRSKHSDDDLISLGNTKRPIRPATPVSIDEKSSKDTWQDYLMVPATATVGRPRELLFHTPSAGAVVTVKSFDASGGTTPPSRLRAPSIALLSHGAQALPSASQPSEPQQFDVTVSSADFLPQIHEPEADAPEKEPVKILLDQLNELHDTIQADKAVKWNDFLRKVRAGRANMTDRASNNAPEADLLNGELIGISSLGRSTKTKARYLQFKSLVLHGITTTLRPKIWSECAGASMLRIPGYYDDLVTRSEDGTDIDHDNATQIRADIRRTLPDNIFFRTGPGVEKLEELLLAYSLHNPRIGYCQGMNLITASLLLICATSEDCFWLLVAIIDHILPSGYFDRSLLVSRADQIVLKTYVAEVLPKLDAHLQDLGVELEACTFHWFLSLYAGVLTGGEALYRIWDCILCLNSSDTPNIFNEEVQQQQPGQSGKLATLTGLEIPGFSSTTTSQPPTPTLSQTPIANNTTTPEDDNNNEHAGTSSPFLFQLSLALLKLNEPQILSLDSPAEVYSYINHNMTNHAISIDGLVSAAEALRSKVKRVDVLERRKRAVAELRMPPV